jgi:diamine N-acetyltransferase
MASPGFQMTRITINDLHRLLDLSRRTFIETFARWNTAEDMRIYLDDHLSEAKIAGELLNPDSEFYLASAGEQPAGYLKLNCGNAQTVQPHTDGLEIERVYVVSDMKGKKLGQQFIQTAIGKAVSYRLSYVWLGVWENNTPAIRFYEKMGFNAYDKHPFILGKDIQTDLLMKLTVR